MALIVFDKDGVLVKPIEGKYPKYKDQQPIEGAQARIAELAAQGHRIAVATNQGGMMFGYKSWVGVFDECRELLDLFPEVELVAFSPDYGQTCSAVFRTSCATSCVSFDEKFPGLIGSFRKGKPGEKEKVKPFVVLKKHGIKAGLDALKRYFFPRDMGQGGGMLTAIMLWMGAKAEDTYFCGDMDSDREAAIAAGVGYIDVRNRSVSLPDMAQSLMFGQGYSLSDIKKYGSAEGTEEALNGTHLKPFAEYLWRSAQAGKYLES